MRQHVQMRLEMGGWGGWEIPPIFSAIELSWLQRNKKKIERSTLFILAIIFLLVYA